MRCPLACLLLLAGPVAALWTTEGGIYPRVGYGVATTAVMIDADRDRSRRAEIRRAVTGALTSS